MQELVRLNFGSLIQFVNSQAHQAGQRGDAERKYWWKQCAIHLQAALEFALLGLKENSSGAPDS